MFIAGACLVSFGLGGFTAYVYLHKRCIVVSGEQAKLIKKIKYII
jgi:hypothetical protein